MGSGETRIVIALDSAAPVVTGRVEVPGAPIRPFAGWIGLLSALRAGIAPPPGPGSPEPEAQEENAP